MPGENAQETVSVIIKWLKDDGWHISDGEFIGEGSNEKAEKISLERLMDELQNI